MKPDWPFPPPRLSITRNCLTCGQEFSFLQYRNKTAKYCSLKCLRKYARTRLFDLSCVTCNNPFKARSKNARYCHPCGDKMKRERLLKMLVDCEAFEVKPGLKIRDVEQRLIEMTVKVCGMTEEAAQMLGISFRTLYNKRNAYEARGKYVGQKEQGAGASEPRAEIKPGRDRKAGRMLGAVRDSGLGDAA